MPRHYLLVSLLAFTPVLGLSRGEAKEPKAAAQRVALHTWYSPSRGDYFTTSDPKWLGRAGDERAPDYRFVRVEGEALAAPAPGATPLYHWWSAARGDNFVTTNPAWAGKPGAKHDGYSFVRVVGYVWTSPGPKLQPLRRQWSSKLADNGVMAGDKAAPKGYADSELQGYVLEAAPDVDIDVQPEVAQTTMELPVPSGSTCGNLGQACCPGARLCEDGVTCDGGTCVPCPTPLEQQPPQEFLSRDNVVVGNNCLGTDRRMVYGNTCDTGFRHGECSVTIVDACDVCTAQAQWLAPEHLDDCRCEVQFHTPADCTKSITVDVMLTQTPHVALQHGLIGCPGSW